MVQITDNNNYSNSKYNEYFELFQYDLSPFQKHAIQGIVDGNHVLITAATGSGKTLPAEFAIQHCINQGKRVIYCSPIKALSNQKTYDFRIKYPHISFGLLTGDIKSNPCAQVLIMTTEILMNKLYTGAGADESNGLSFSMDIDSELGCVIFDEMHYINDEHRGHVWEQSIMMLPPHVQMVMLSATLDDPVKFAKWIETRKGAEGADRFSAEGADRFSAEGADRFSADGLSASREKHVVLCSTDKRIVPLSHYSFLCSTESLFKKLKCKETEQRVKQSLNKCLPLQSADGQFNETVYKEVKGVLQLMEDNSVYMKRKNVLNQLATHMYENEMLPAIAFVFSRKLVEQCAQDIDVRVLEDDSKVTYIVRNECEAVLRRLPNWREYAGLPEYEELVRLLEKGIGIHHSGMIPVLREIVELMISKKYIKLLFATESFAIGLDCPIRTAVFLGLSKYTGDGLRYLYAHEYTQMAGRAGRRGIDTIGHVIHCNNLFDVPSLTTYKEILCGKPQKLVSKFQLYYPVVINGCNVENSMYQEEIAIRRKGLEQELALVEESIVKKDAGFQYLDTPRDVLAVYFDLLNKQSMSANKKRKEIDAHIRKLKDAHRHLEKDVVYYRDYIKILANKDDVQVSIQNNDAYIRASVNALKDVLREFGLWQESEESATSSLMPLEELNNSKRRDYKAVETTSLSPNTLDSATSSLMPLEELNDSKRRDYKAVETTKLSPNTLVPLAEINPVLFSLIYEYIRGFSPIELVTFFSVFCQKPKDNDDRVYTADYEFLEQAAAKLQNAESLRGIHVKENGLGPFCYDLLDIMPQWCECTDEAQCKQVLAQLAISVGDFTKAILKISTIGREIANTLDSIDTEFVYNLSKIDELILKFVATNQSLYI